MSHRLLLIACLCAAGYPARAAAQDALPQLHHIYTSSSVESSPASRLTPIAVGPQGSVLFTSGNDATTQLLLTDSTGKVVLRFGHNGAGPGEVAGARPLLVSLTALGVWDRGNGRYTEWNLQGKLLSSITPEGSFDASDATSVDVFGMHNVGRALWPVAMTRPAGTMHDMLQATDTFMLAHFAGTKGGGFSPLGGRWSGGFVVGDATNYRIALYRPDGTLVRVLGRDLPATYPSAGRVDDFINEMKRRSASGGGFDPARIEAMRGQAMKMALPQIVPGSPIRTDSHNRMWVTGMEGDSAFADLFTADHFIGRLHLPCRLFNGYWSISGTWLALACLPDDPAFDGDAVVKLFKVVG